MCCTSMKGKIDKLDGLHWSEIFLLAERHRQENEKIRHRLEENVCRSISDKACCPKYIQTTPKTQ